VGVGLTFGGYTEDTVKQYFSFLVFCSQYIGAVARLVPMVTVVERGDVIGAWSFSNIRILQSILLHCIVCQVKVMINICGSYVKWMQIVRKLY
jgi:hypothetical protein